MNHLILKLKKSQFIVFIPSLIWLKFISNEMLNHKTNRMILIGTKLATKSCLIYGDCMCASNETSKWPFAQCDLLSKSIILSIGNKVSNDSPSEDLYQNPFLPFIISSSPSAFLVWHQYLFAVHFKHHLTTINAIIQTVSA